jgi:hypothetical protein
MDASKGEHMRTSAAILLAAALGLASVSAQAMPFPSAPGAGDAVISHVAYGCGPGMTIGPYGHCRPKFTCPPGWHPGPYGFHCFRNW